MIGTLLSISPAREWVVDTASSVTAASGTAASGTGASATGGTAPGTAPPQPSIDELRRLSPEAHAALLGAQKAARSAGHELWLTAGFPDVRVHQQLANDAVQANGSGAAAGRAVAQSEQPAGATGTTLDLVPQSATNWLAENGRRFGLCRTFDLAWWHFEYRAEWQRTNTCPASVGG